MTEENKQDLIPESRSRACTQIMWHNTSEVAEQTQVLEPETKESGLIGGDESA